MLRWQIRRRSVDYRGSSVRFIFHRRHYRRVVDRVGFQVGTVFFLVHFYQKQMFTVLWRALRRKTIVYPNYRRCY